MNWKKALVLAVVLVLAISAVAIVAEAKSDKAQGKGKGLDKDKGPTGNVAAKGNQNSFLQDENGEDENETEDDDEDEDENETNGKINQGRLISEAQRTRRDEWKITKEMLREAGYHGPVNEFATSYNQYLHSLKDEIRGKITADNTTNLSQATVREVAERELARIREEILAGMNLTGEDVNDSIDDLINETNETNETNGNETNETNETTTSIIQAELAGMNNEFSASLYGVSEFGSIGEREQLRTQFQEYADVVRERRLLLIHIEELDREQIREQLEQGASVQEIIETFVE